MYIIHYKLCMYVQTSRNCTCMLCMDFLKILHGADGLKVSYRELEKWVG